MTGGNLGNSSSEVPASNEAAHVDGPPTLDPLANYIVDDVADRSDTVEGQTRVATIDQRIAAETEAARIALGMPSHGSDLRPTTPRMTPGDVLVPLVFGQPLGLVKFLPTRVSPYRSPVAICQTITAILSIELFLCTVVLSAGVVGARGLSVILVFVAALFVDFFARAGLLVFIYRAYANLLSFGAAGLMSTPAMAVACWFMPLVSFFRPCQAVQEIWRASDPGVRLDPHYATGWQTSPSSPLVTGWWLSMFLFIPLIAFQISTDTDLMSGSYYATMSCGFIVNALLTLLVLNGIARRQEARFAAMAGVSLT